MNVDFSSPKIQEVLSDLKLTTCANFQPRAFARAFSDFLNLRNEVYQARLLDATNAIMAIEDGLQTYSLDDATDIYTDSSVLAAPDGSIYAIGSVLGAYRQHVASGNDPREFVVTGVDQQEWSIDDLLDFSSESIMNAAAMATVLDELQSSVELIPTVSSADVQARLSSQFSGRIISLSSFPGLWEVASDPTKPIEDKIRDIASLYGNIDVVITEATDHTPVILEWGDEHLSKCTGASPILAAFTLAADIVDSDGVLEAVKAVFNLVKSIFNNVLKPLFDAFMSTIKGFLGHKALAVDTSAASHAWNYPYRRDVTPTNVHWDHVKGWASFFHASTNKQQAIKMYNAIPRNDGEKKTGGVYDYPLHFPLNVADVYAWRSGADAHFKSGYGFNLRYSGYGDCYYRSAGGDNADSIELDVIKDAISIDIPSDQSLSYLQLSISSLKEWYDWSTSDGISDSILFCFDAPIHVGDGCGCRVAFYDPDGSWYEWSDRSFYPGADVARLKAIVFEGYPSRVTIIWQSTTGEELLDMITLEDDMRDAVHNALFGNGTFRLRFVFQSQSDIPFGVGFSHFEVFTRYCNHQEHSYDMSYFRDECIVRPAELWSVNADETVFPSDGDLHYRIYVRPQHATDTYGRTILPQNAIMAWISGTHVDERSLYPCPAEVFGGLAFEDPDPDSPSDILSATRESLLWLVAYAAARHELLAELFGLTADHWIDEGILTRGKDVLRSSFRDIDLSSYEVKNSDIVSWLGLSDQGDGTFMHPFDPSLPVIEELMDGFVYDLLMNAHITTQNGVTNTLLDQTILDALFIPAKSDALPTSYRYRVVSDEENAVRGGAAIATLAVLLLLGTVKIAKVARKKKLKKRLSVLEANERNANKVLDRKLANPKATKAEKKQALKEAAKARKKKTKAQNRLSKLGAMDSPNAPSLPDILSQLADMNVESQEASEANSTDVDVSAITARLS